MAWYEDAWRLAYVATYKSERAATDEAERALRHGWTIQNTSAIDGHVKLGGAALSTLVLGPIGLLALGNRTKGKFTLTYVRPAGWVAPPRTPSSASGVLKWSAIIFGVLVMIGIANNINAAVKRTPSTDDGQTAAVAVVASPTRPAERATATATAVAQSPQAAVPATVTATVWMYEVGNTGGEGVFIRRSARSDDRIKAWPDGTSMTYLGDSVQADGREWRRVLDPDNTSGWVPADYLVPSTRPATAARSTPSPDAGLFVDVPEWFGKPVSLLQTKWGRADYTSAISVGKLEGVPGGGQGYTYLRPWGFVDVLTGQGTILEFQVILEKPYVSGHEEMLRRLGLPTSIAPSLVNPFAMQWDNLNGLEVRMSLSEGRVAQAVIMRSR